MEVPCLYKTNDVDIIAARAATVTLDLGKKAPEGNTLTVRQRKHAFLFGSNAFPAIPLANNMPAGEKRDWAALVTERMLDICNFVTLPFYWGGFEPEEGKPHTTALLNTAKWFKERNVTVKGHPLCWHTLCVPWLLDRSNADILKTQLARIVREIGDFKGVIDMWDVVNEAVIMPIFDKYDNAITRVCNEIGRIPLIRKTFETARATSPGATLILNDFDYTEPYEILIEGCLESGIPIDVIGIQSHMHQGYWGVEKTLKILERYERFGLPIHFSETSIISGDLMPEHIVDLNDWQPDSWPSTPEGEARQAEEVALHYRTLFSRPLVQGLTWWDFPDGQWLKAPSGLVRADNSIKPAYTALKNLIKDEWWGHEKTLKANDKAQICFKAFPGEYEAIVDGQAIKFTIPGKGAFSQSL